MAGLGRSDHEEAALLTQVDEAISNRQRLFAHPAIASTARGSSTFASTAAQAEGKAYFDVVRARLGALGSALAHSATAARSTLQREQDIFIAAASLLALVLVVAAMAAGRALQTWVTGPLGRLQGDVRQVAGGDLGHPVGVSGPPDLVALAQDVESMRERVLAEVSSSARATDELKAVNEDLARSNTELEQFAYVASRPPGAVAQGRELLSATGEPVRGPAGRAGA